MAAGLTSRRYCGGRFQCRACAGSVQTTAGRVDARETGNLDPAGVRTPAAAPQDGRRTTAGGASEAAETTPLLSWQSADLRTVCGLDQVIAVLTCTDAGDQR
jgi:hypothetical protein